MLSKASHSSISSWEADSIVLWCTQPGRVRVVTQLLWGEQGRQSQTRHTGHEEKRPLKPGCHFVAVACCSQGLHVSGFSMNLSGFTLNYCKAAVNIVNIKTPFILSYSMNIVTYTILLVPFTVSKTQSLLLVTSSKFSFVLNIFFNTIIQYILLYSDQYFSVLHKV